MRVSGNRKDGLALSCGNCTQLKELQDFCWCNTATGKNISGMKTRDPKKERSISGPFFTLPGNPN